MVQKSRKPSPSAASEAVAPKRRGRPRAYQPKWRSVGADLFRKMVSATSLDDLALHRHEPVEPS
jgi:hypothetical protein